MAGRVGLVAAPVTGRETVRLRLELSPAVLLRLLREGCLCAADFRCLDSDTHRCVRRLLLQSCRARWWDG